MGNDSRIKRDRLANRRAGPVVLFLDCSMELRAASLHGELLWNQFAAAITALGSEQGANVDGTVQTITPDGSHAVSLIRLCGDEGYAVLLDPLADDDRSLAHFALTRREREVAQLLVEGANTPEIAKALSIAPTTAMVHVKSIMAKTGSRTRAAAVGRMVRHDGDALATRRNLE